ncbi:MAG: ribonuclease HII [Candidatus Paceibacterota bacterium]
MVVVKQREQFLIGIDEAGRGPLAGPVVVGGVKIRSAVLAGLPPIRDSKKLTAKERENWFIWLKKENKNGNLFFAFSLAGHRLIDRRGIVYCLDLAVSRILQKIPVKQADKILLDGNLRAPAGYKNQQTIIRGDETEGAIALASIVAKVTRDRLMTRLDKKYPPYGFATHKGYATENHYLALLQYGRSAIHRRSFTRFLD